MAMKVAKLKKGHRVKAKRAHECLDVTAKDVGIVASVGGTNIEVQFKHKRHTVIFQSDELIRQRIR